MKIRQAHKNNGKPEFKAIILSFVIILSTTLLVGCANLNENDSTDITVDYNYTSSYTNESSNTDSSIVESQTSSESESENNKEGEYTDDELVEIALNLLKPENNVSAWIFEGESLEIIENKVLDNEDPNDYGIYALVGRFNTIQELIDEALEIVTIEYMETYFYDYFYTDRDNSVPYPLLKEVEGKLYINISPDGVASPLPDFDYGEVIIRPDDSTAILKMHHTNIDLYEKDFFEIQIIYENGAWKYNPLYN